MTAPVTHRYLLELTDPHSTDPESVGSKAATLARLARVGFDVPEAVILNARAFQDAVGALEQPTQELISSLDLPESVETALLKIADRFGDTPVAVRSSGIAEDLAGSSFAGQYETVLGVVGAEQLLDAVRRCWASAFSARVEVYRHQRGFESAAPMAVIVQRMVDAEAAGVAFTADPTTGATDVVIVDAIRGLGDRLVSGEKTPEQWRIHAGGEEATFAGDAVLTSSQARAVAHLARRIDTHLGGPQDIEWAIEGDSVRVLQARAVTGLPADTVEHVPVPVEVPEGYWERDVSHQPSPLSPLGRSTTYPLANRHSGRFCSEFGMLAEKIILTDIGGWHYVRIVPLGGKDRKAPPSWVIGIMARLHPVLRRRVRTAIEAIRTEKARRIIGEWYGDVQPDLSRRIEQLGRSDLGSLDDREILDHLAATVELFEDGIVSHIFVHAAQMVETYGLVVACRDLLGWGDHRVLEILAGLSHRTSEPARELAGLARMAKERPRVLSLLTEITEETPSLIAGADPEFAAAFEAYRWSASGFRALSRDVADATLADQPELLLRLIANQLETGFDPDSVDIAHAKRRAELIAEAHRRLADRPEDLRRLDEAFERATTAYPLREDNVFYALQAPLGLIRYAALEIGDRMTQRGQVDHRDDVFFLEYDELTSALADGREQHDLVRRRKGERAWVLAHPGPAAYGTPPGPPPSLRYLPPEVQHATEAFFWTMDNAIDTGKAQHTAEGGIRGVAASLGRYRGTVRVIMDESEFDKLRPGDVVVCPVTQPTWSILFPSMGALVTDSGGILAHPAIIAREYRIPAVVATGNATALLRDGQVVTVDGSTGVVSPEG